MVNRFPDIRAVPDRRKHPHIHTHTHTNTHTHAHTHTNTAKFKNTGKHKLQNSDIEKLLAVKVDNQLDFQAPLNAVSKNN